jgi:hypothetical protein
MSSGTRKLSKALAPPLSSVRLSYSSIVSLACWAMTTVSSSMANATDRSSPCGPVISTRTPHETDRQRPALIGFCHVLAACFDGRLDPLTTGGWDSFAVEDG